VGSCARKHIFDFLAIRGEAVPRRWDEGSVAVVMSTLVVALCIRGTHSCVFAPEAITAQHEWLCVPAVHIPCRRQPTKSSQAKSPHTQSQTTTTQKQQLSNRQPPIDVLGGSINSCGAHGGGSTRTRLLFTVFNRHLSDPYRFIAFRGNPLSS
jgi:hypothetical protein